jgi:Icc-related predicted phosphoesterase
LIKFEVSLESSKYLFIGIDTSNFHGFKRPYNFFGKIKKETMEELEDILKKSNHDHVILFSHTPR